MPDASWSSASAIPGRQDDGLGPALVELLEAAALEGVALDANYQLNVEDALACSQHDSVIFDGRVRDMRGALCIHGARARPRDRLHDPRARARRGPGPVRGSLREAAQGLDAGYPRLRLGHRRGPLAPGRGQPVSGPRIHSWPPQELDGLDERAPLDNRDKRQAEACCCSCRLQALQ